MVVDVENVEESNELDELLESEEELSEESIGETEEESDSSEDEESEEGEEETLITFDGEETPPQEEDRSAPEWVKDLRKQHKEQVKLNRELEAKIKELTAKEEKPLELSPKPKLEDYDYDTEEFEKALETWHIEKRAYTEKQEDIKKQEEKSREAWQSKLNTYNESKSSLKVKDFEEAEFVVTSTLDQTQQGIIVQGADNPAALAYAIGKSPSKAKALASIKDPIEFAFAVAKLETTMKVSNRKSSPPPPEKKVSGNANLSGTVDSTLERLRADAEKTGDYSKVTAYKRKKKQ